MTTPVRLQLSRRRGFRLQAHSQEINGLPAVNCARPGPWGNPFVEKRATFRHRAVERYRLWLAGQVVGVAPPDEDLVAAIPLLCGLNLACWCPLPAPGEPDICHAAVLLEIANR